MFGSTVLDTAIGLAFVFLLVSLACSAAKEFVEVMLKQRASYLELGLVRMLGGKKGSKPAWLEKLHQHSLIQALTKDPDKWPSYIPSYTFAKAMLDLIRTESKDAQAQGMPTSAREIESLIGKIKDADKVKEILLSVVGTTTRTLEDVQAEIETWFNNSMERVSGWYKQWSQMWILAIGAVLVLLLNVDAIAIGRALWQDPALRAALVAAAQKEVDEPAQKEAKTKGGEDPEAAWKRAKEAAARVSELGVPVGWDRDDPRSVPPLSGSQERVLRGWLLKLLGWLITIMAVSLGAPFWFDLLNRFMIVRSTVRPKEKSPEEPPIDEKKKE